MSYSKGLRDLGDGIYAYLQPDGSWGYSNAGLVADSGESLLVDTLFDLHLTAEMLQAMRRAEPAAQRIGTLVNTHANGDHCYGNQLVEGARVITSAATAAVTSTCCGTLVADGDSRCMSWTRSRPRWWTAPSCRLAVP